MKYLHIISFDIPFPANYGGVIDVYYKLKALHARKVKIILHCFEYGREHSAELDKYCEKVYYYKRSRSFIHQFSSIPFIVKTRVSEDLVRNLLNDNYPILFEGLHTCGVLEDTRLKKRIKIYRESNIEHEYYRHLAKAESSFLKRMYFLLEAKKLKQFEQKLRFADVMLVVSEEDTKYLKNKFPNKNIQYLPSFHPYSNLMCKTGRGSYALYHGNLSISENYLAALFLVTEVFSGCEFNFKIAGLNPPESLMKLVSQHNNIELIINPSDESLQELIVNAHINCLYTHQETGLKLKLLNSLFAGRFCLLNDKMLYGTSLSDICKIANTGQEMKKSIQYLFSQDFTLDDIHKRGEKLRMFDVTKNAEVIVGII